MLTAIQKTKSSLAAGLFAALLISCTPVIAADTVTNPPSTGSYSDYMTWTNAALFTFFLTQIRLWTREGDTAPVRYNLDELAAGENIADNIYYLVDDGVIGHFGKKPYLTVDTDNQRVEVQLADAEDANGKPIKDAQGNKVKVSTACYPKGIMGCTAYYIKPILGALGTVVTIKLLVDSYNEANQSGKSFAEIFFGKLAYAKNLVFPKMTDAGTAPAINILGTVVGK